MNFRLLHATNYYKFIRFIVPFLDLAFEVK